MTEVSQTLLTPPPAPIPRPFASVCIMYMPEVFVVVFVRHLEATAALRAAARSPLPRRRPQTPECAASVAKRLPALEPGGQSTAEAIDRLLQASAEQAITKWHSL